MKKTNNKANNEPLSDFEETLIWTSYRYCIGRHTYVTSMAGDIAKNYYHRLSDFQMERMCKDIRTSIYDSIRFAPVNYIIDYSVPEEERRPAEWLIEFFIKNQIYTTDDLAAKKYKEIEVYKEKWGDTEIKYRVAQYTENTPDRYYSFMDFSLMDIIPWMDLASVFDKKHYKVVTVEYDGKVEKHLAFETYREETEEIEDKPGWCTTKQGHWVKRYVSVNHYISGRNSGYIVPEYITSVKDYEFDGTPDNEHDDNAHDNGHDVFDVLDD